MKNLFFALVAMFVVVSCSTNEHYVIKGSLEGATDEMVVLQKRVGTEMVRIDSVYMTDGTFEFAKGAVDYPEMFYLAVDGKRGSLGFFVENSQILLAGHVDTIYDVKVEGSLSQTEYDAYNSSTEPFFERNSELYMEYSQAKQDGDEETAEKINKQRELLFEELGTFQSEYVKANPASFVTPVILRSISYQMELDELEEAVNALDEKVEVSEIVKDLKLRVDALKRVQVGEKAPDFTQNDVDGNPVTLSEIKDYKVLLIDFWAAWCGPCRGENPNVVAVYNDYNKMGFEILGVSLDSENDDWLKAIDDDGLAWLQVSDLGGWGNEVAKLYAVNSIPANFLLDSEGVIIAKGLRGEKLREKIASLLAE